jgi:hypothetical protein
MEPREKHPRNIFTVISYFGFYDFFILSDKRAGCLIGGQSNFLSAVLQWRNPFGKPKNRKVKKQYEGFRMTTPFIKKNDASYIFLAKQRWQKNNTVSTVYFLQL